MKRSVMIAGVAGVLVTGSFAAGRITGTSPPVAPGNSPRVASDSLLEVATTAVIAEAADHRSFDREAADLALRARSTVEDGPRLVDQRRRQEESVAAAWPGGPTRWWVAPLAARLISHTADTAQVDVWFAEVIAPPGVTPMGDWRVTTVKLRRQADVWKVADVADRLGPVLRTRSSPPMSAAGLSSFVDGFEAVDHA